MSTVGLKSNLEANVVHLPLVSLQGSVSYQNVVDYPLKIAQQSVSDTGTSTRAAHKGKPINIGKSTITRNSSVSDLIRIWNLASSSITESKSAYQAKNAIKKFARSIPV